MRGRTIIGTGIFTDGLSTTTYSLAERGGEKQHQLTIDEMPSHYHEQGDPAEFAANGYNPNHTAGGRNVNTGGRGLYAYTFPTGGNSPHNNMMPYVAMNWIMKI